MKTLTIIMTLLLLSTAFLAAEKLIDLYPNFSGSPLSNAKLSKLPRNVLLRSGDIMIKKSDIDNQIKEASNEIRPQLEDNAIFLLEQKFTEAVLLEEGKEAMAKKGVSKMDDKKLIESYIRDLADGVKVSEQELVDFYASNKELMGGAPYESVKSQISAYLKQQKQQEFIADYIQKIAERRTVEIAEAWGREKMNSAKNNPVDKARNSGKPTLANFGSDSCVPCQMMIPAREAIKKHYGDKVNVVYIHVDKDQILASRYRVQSIPTLIFFDKKGQERNTHVGMMSEDEMKENLNSLLGVKCCE